MGQDKSLKSERKIHDLNHDLTFSVHTINCMCHSIMSMFRPLGIYNFVTHQQPQQSCSGSFLGNLQNVLQSSLPKLSTSLDMEVTLEFDC